MSATWVLLFLMATSPTVGGTYFSLAACNSAGAAVKNTATQVVRWVCVPRSLNVKS